MHNVLLTPLPFQFYFPPQFFSFSLLHNFIIFPPQCFYSLLHNFIIFPPRSLIPSLSTILIFPRLLLIFFPPPSQFLLFSPLNLDFPPPPQFHYFPSSTSTSFILYIFRSTNTSTSYRPYIDPTLTPHRLHIDPRSTQHRP